MQSKGITLAKLGKLNTASLRALYKRTFGRTTSSNDKEYLRKRIAHRLGEQAKDERRAQSRRADLGRGRDARLPPPGTLLRRDHKGEAHEVKVLAEGFEYAGETYGSLSTIAKVISGTVWNGFGFFRRALNQAVR